MDQAIKAMSDCYLACTKTIQHCLEMGSKHASPEHINILIDCARVCNMASDFACRKSENHKEICDLCAEICRQCADACESMADGDQEMLKCAEICRKCADECENMADSKPRL